MLFSAGGVISNFCGGKCEISQGQLRGLNLREGLQRAWRALPRT